MPVRPKNQGSNRSPTRDLAHDTLRGQPHADIEELADAGLGGQEPDDPAQEAPVLQCQPAQPGTSASTFSAAIRSASKLSLPPEVICERGREVRWGVHGEVGQRLGGVAPDYESAECVAVVDALGSPAALPSGSLQRVACCRDVADLWRGEEIEVFRGPRRQVLREQSGSPSQQEALARGQRKDSLATSNWKSVRSGVPSVPLSSPLAVPGIYAAAARDAWITGAHADRIACGRTRSAHRSRSSAPLT